MFGFLCVCTCVLQSHLYMRLFWEMNHPRVSKKIYNVILVALYSISDTSFSFPSSPSFPFLLFWSRPSFSLHLPSFPPGTSSVPEFFRIMTRQFTAYEWSVIQSAGSEHLQLAAFYRHWVTMATVLLFRHIALLLGPTGGVCVGGHREEITLSMSFETHTFVQK